MTESAAAIERSDVCAVPAAAVVGEAMVALVARRRAGREVRRRLGRRSCASVDAGRRVRAERFRAEAATRPDRADAPADPAATASRPLHAPAAARHRASTTSLQRLIDDMIETMYAAPGHRAGGAAGRRAAARLRRRSVGRAATRRS